MKMLAQALSVAVVMGLLFPSDDLPPVRLPRSSVFEPPAIRIVDPVVCTVLVTAYNSEVNQTDSTPYRTSYQTRTRRGVVAARWLPRGTRVLLTTNHDDPIFVVEDRMPPKNWCKLDRWERERSVADERGKEFAEVVILGAPPGFSCPDLPETKHHKCPVPTTEWGMQAAKPIRIAWSR